MGQGSKIPSSPTFSRQPKKSAEAKTPALRNKPKSYRMPEGSCIVTPGPMGRPKVIQIIRKIIHAICRQTAIGMRFDTRVPMAALGIYFSWATERIIHK